MGKEVVGKIEQTEIRTVAIEDLIPYMDERPLTDEVLEEIGFERKVWDECDEPSYYYSLELFPDDDYNDLTLISGYNNEAQEVVLFPYKKPVFKTAGGVTTVLMGLLGE